MNIITDKIIPEFYIQTFSLLFFPEDNNFSKNFESKNHIIISIDRNITVKICYNNKTAVKTEIFENKTENDPVIQAGKLFYKAAGEITGIYPPWGIYTGIRPAVTAGDILIKNDFNIEKTVKKLCGDYMMYKNKAELAVEIFINNFKRGLYDVRENEYSLYISIPFCPTRCKYCSFTSFTGPKLLKLIPEYIKKLTEEIEQTGKITKNMNLKSVYIGGGTPTVLNCESLKIILNAVKNNFNIEYINEYTVECGRADTINEEKLILLKSFGIDRISVNPQTINDDVLQKIGRIHTSEDFYRAFFAAKKSGIKNINTDCIIGLPGESRESMINTINTLIDLKPENITVHSLCIKKSSELKKEKYEISKNMNLNEIAEKYYKILINSGYKPYYLYRQKYTAENLENIGFCLDDHECLYNIYMMDELQTIFGMGAGAITKIVKNKKIERIANYKYPYEYIENDFQINKESNNIKLKILREE